MTQIVGRAARNEHGKVIMYCDKISDAMQKTIDETKRRREIQERYNKENNIIPHTIIKEILPPVHMIDNEGKVTKKKSEAKLTRKELEQAISKLSKEMLKASKDLDFEKAAQLRDQLFELKVQLGDMIKK